MNDDVRVLGLVGSLRRGSVNKRLMDAAGDLLGSGSTVDVFDHLKDIPPFDEDDEAVVPRAVEELRARIAIADAVLVVTPEYNGSVPGQLKNAIDWASRPFATSVLRGKHIAVIGASPSPGGARTAIADAQRILSRAGATVIPETTFVPRVFEHLDHTGALNGYDVRTSIANVTSALLAAARPNAYEPA